MSCVRAGFSVIAALAGLLPVCATAQMHRVASPETVTRAVGVYEYVGDLQHPKAARLTPVSLFIGGHFEDAGVYLARPIPFALDGGLRYELQRAGLRQEFLDVIASRNFASSSAAAATPFDDGWFGYGRTAPLPTPKPGRLRANCGNARVVQENDPAKKDDSKPHFGSKPADTPAPAAGKRAGRDATPDPCADQEPERAERVSLADDTKKDSNSPDPERPTLHRSPETSAHNTTDGAKPDKKAPKPPPATVTANGNPGDDPDRPTIRHRATDENDPNALPPDPIDLASTEHAKTVAKAEAPAAAPSAAASPASANDTVGEGGTISAGDTTSGRPVLHRGRTTPAPQPAPVVAAKAAAPAAATPSVAPPVAIAGSSGSAVPREVMVAVSDAKDRPAHDFSYHFSPAERASALESLQGMARAVLANPALATDAPESARTSAAPAKPAPAKPASATPRTATHSAGTAATHPRTAAATRARVRPAAPVSVTAPQSLADETMAAYQLYFSAPVTYVYSARMPATASAPERFVTVIAQTDAEGKLQPAMRTVTDAAHLDRIPRYRLIDVVDADGSNRASLLMELREQHTRQFALYRLLGNKPDQVFITGTTLL